MMILIVNFLLLNKTNPRSNNFRIKRLLRKLLKSNNLTHKIVNLLRKSLLSKLSLTKELWRKLLLPRRNNNHHLRKSKVQKMKNLKSQAKENPQLRKLLFLKRRTRKNHLMMKRNLNKNLRKMWKLNLLFKWQSLLFKRQNLLLKKQSFQKRKRKNLSLILILNLHRNQIN